MIGAHGRVLQRAFARGRGVIDSTFRLIHTVRIVRPTGAVSTTVTTMEGEQ